MSAAQKSNSWIREAAQQAGIPYTTVLHRIQAGKSLEEATRSENAAKRSVKIAGVLYLSLAEAELAYGVSAKRIGWRISQGWTPEEAVNVVKRAAKKPRPSQGKSLTVNGQTFTSIKAAAVAFGMAHHLLASRLKKGLTPEQALNLVPPPEWFVAGKGQVAKVKAEAKRRQELATGLKTCYECKKHKPLNDFNKAKETILSGRCKSCTALALIRCRYGISGKEFHEIKTLQCNKCAICRRELMLGAETVSRPITVAVDHCHKTGAVRGLLCNRCNSGIGMLGDSVSRLRSAIKYLERANR